jgi:H/ACA ribonucleoprotein complex subunit 4
MLPFQLTDNTILLKRACDTSDRFGASPDNRPMSTLIGYGVVNLDKPKGPTSHQATDYAKKILGISKAGHSGTLDPKVTGVLPIALGRGTRVVQSLLTAGKEYVALMRVHKALPEEVIRRVCNDFVGKIRQLPPIKSSVKRQWRERSIYYLEIIEINGQDVLFRVGTQAGTYIRKLIHDIGSKLGCGAHMAELRRTRAGPFDETTLVTLQDLIDALHYFQEQGNERFLRKVIQPLETAVSHLPKVWVMDTAVDSLCHGASLKVPGICKIQGGIAPGDSVAVMTLKDELIATCTSRMTSEAMMKLERGIAASSSKVFMLPGTYPKIERVI